MGGTLGKLRCPSWKKGLALCLRWPGAVKGTQESQGGEVEASQVAPWDQGSPPAQGGPPLWALTQGAAPGL